MGQLWDMRERRIKDDSKTGQDCNFQGWGGPWGQVPKGRTVHQILEMLSQSNK